MSFTDSLLDLNKLEFKAILILPNFDKEFEENIYKELAKIYNVLLLKTEKASVNRIKTFMQKSLKKSSVYREFLKGKNSRLINELGLENGSDRLDAIFDYILKNVNVKYSLDATGNAKVDIKLGPDSLYDLLKLPEAYYYSLNRKGETTKIEWLRWLLFEGGNNIVHGYRVFYRPRAGRTGAWMVTSSRSWSVPAEFQGTEEDNFITRSLEGLQIFVTETMQRELSRKLSTKRI